MMACLRLPTLLFALAALLPAIAQAQPAFLAACGDYAASRGPLDARPHASAIGRCYARHVRAARDIPAQDRKRLLAARPGPNRRISVATIHSMERINRVCWREARRKRNKRRQ